MSIQEDDAMEHSEYSGRSLVSLVTSTDADIPMVDIPSMLFSSPQNRSSTRRLSIQLNNSSKKTSTPLRGLHEEDGSASGGGGPEDKIQGQGEDGSDERNDSAHGKGKGPSIGTMSLSIPKNEAEGTTVEPSGDSKNTSIADDNVGGVSPLVGNDVVSPMTRSAKSRATPRSTFISPRKGRKSVQEVLGKLPILIVDDSVSVLKMTKRAILNECANIRCLLSPLPSHSPLHFSPLPLTYFLTQSFQQTLYPNSFMEAKNGEEAYNLVVGAATEFELIITDIQMPICDGFQFTRKVKGIPVVFSLELTPFLQYLSSKL